MGILTADKIDKHPIGVFLGKYGNKLSFLCFIVGIIVAALLTTENYVDSTYFSDNALLPGLVNRDFNHGKYASIVYQSLVGLSSASKAEVQQFIFDEFRKIGLHVYRHNYTLRYPFGKREVLEGTNIYAILRAPRAPGTEALVLSSPLRLTQKASTATLPGIALIFALAKSFATKNYWAKDIIFLVNDRELVGVQAWLNAYHEVEKTPVLDHGFLPAKSGPIQAALNLEIHGEHNTRVDLKIEGLNGQLPNLDLFNVAVELATRESITPTIHGHSHPFSANFYETWSDYAKTISSMMVSQASTIPTGAHGIFQKYAIQALTIEGIARRTPDKDLLTVSFHQIGRCIDGIFRSLNNLLERFNRSYWFYLLPSTRRYVSIGYYMIPFGLITVPLVLKALNLFLIADKDDGSDKSKPSLWKAMPFTFFCQIFGLILTAFPVIFERFAHFQSDYDVETSDMFYYSLILMSIFYIITPLMSIKPDEVQAVAHRCLALLNLALLLSCLSLLNISLAIFLSFIHVPIVCLVGGRFSSFFGSIRKFLSIMALVALHPLVISFLCIFGMSFVYDLSSLNLEERVLASFKMHKKLILYFVEDWYIHGNWMYFFGTALLFPTWLQFWYLLVR